MPGNENFDALFTPSPVAVVGASATPGKIGHSVLANLIEAGFKGDLYPVNPSTKEILGIKVLPDIEDLPLGVDLAVIAVPRSVAVDAARGLADRGVKAMIVISAGFKEVGKEGYFLEQQLIELAEKENIALLGPNCLGMINPHAGCNASFASGQPKPGNIAFFSQSGALCVAILDWAMGENIGFSKFISLGNKAVLDEAHMIEYLADDETTKVVLGYIENVENGREFLRLSQQVSHKKPIIMIKSGTTSAGAKAASSHTGAIAGSDNAYEAAFRQGGILRAGDVATLFNLAQAFSSQPLPKGPNLAIVTNSGGPGIMAADACENSSLVMASISAASAEKLQKVLPPWASLYNPIDIIGDAGVERYRDTLKVVAHDQNVHAVLVLLTPTAAIKDQIEDTARAIVEVAATTDIPFFACFMGKRSIQGGELVLQASGIPCYNFPEPAIKSLESMYSYKQWRSKAVPLHQTFERDLEGARSVIDAAQRSGHLEIVEFQAQELLKAYRLPTPRTRLARSSDEAAAAAREIGFPVVLKIASSSISHKSDVKGVLVGLQDEDEVREAFQDITFRAQRLRPEAHITGCLVQEMAPSRSKEVIVGFKRDEQFGPLIMFGLGGIYVEVLKDISFRLAPLSETDAREMMREIRSFLLLKGVRGEAAVNLDAIVHILLAMSQLSLDFPEIYEAEFNPILVDPERAMVADVRVTLGQ